MKDLSDSIESLGKKTDLLIGALQKSVAKSDQLNQENQKLQQKLRDEKEKYSQLVEDNKVLKLAAAIKGNEKTVSESKRKISQMVREIDRCIAKLND